MVEEHVKLFYHPRIFVTSEQAAKVLDIDLQKADKLLSSPDTYSIIQEALQQSVQKALLDTLQQMARQRWPQENIPIRVDCCVELPSLPTMSILNQEV